MFISTPYYGEDTDNNSPDYPPLRSYKPSALPHHKEQREYYPPPRDEIEIKEKNKYSFSVIIIFIFVLILTATALFQPWFNLKLEYEYEYSSFDFGLKFSHEITIDYDLQNITMKKTDTGDNDENEETKFEEYDDHDELKTPVLTTYYLTITSIILAIIIVIILVIARLGYLSYKIGFIIAIINIVFISITLAYFATEFTSSLKEHCEDPDNEISKEQSKLEYDGSLMGSYINEDPINGGKVTRKWSWAPSIGWYLIFASLTLAIIGVALIFIIVRHTQARRASHPPPRDYQERFFGPRDKSRPLNNQDYNDDQFKNRNYNSRPRDKYDSY